MLRSFWRRWLSQSMGTAKRRNVPRQRRSHLWLENLESRDLLSGFTPMYVLMPQAGNAGPFDSPSPTGYSPSQISQAYGFNQISFNNGSVKGDGSGQTIAIVDAYDDPNIQNDLTQFDATFGLPNPSFTKVNQSGGAALPAANSGWATEISLDVEWAHAMAPGAKILLVEANSSSYSDLFSAVQYAASQPGVSVVSMSWGGGEFSGETSYDNSVFTTPSGHQGVAFVASSGDSGAPVSYPAVSPNVLAVGGTSLYLTSSNSYSSESGWTDSTGGLSSYEAQPSYQKGIVTQSSTQRANPDVSYNADPNTGYSVYDSYGTSAPWQQIGGTSAGAPQWAALVAIADQGRGLSGLGTLDGGKQLLPALYQLPSSDFHDVASGYSTGSPSYSTGTGYDLVTGRGSPVANLIVAALAGQSTSSGGSSGSGSGTGSGSGSGSGSGTGSSPTPTLIEGFETSDSWYIANGYSATAYLSTAAAHNGSYGLDDYNGSDWIYRDDSGSQVKAGDTLSVWVQFSGAADGRAYFGFGATPSGTLSLVAAPNTNQLMLQQNSGYSNYTTLVSASQTYQANHWYRLEVDWGTSGKIVGKLYDSNGTTLLGSVTATTTAVTSGGIAFRAIGHDKFWDTVTDTYGVNSFTAPAVSSIASAASGPQLGSSPALARPTAGEQALLSLASPSFWIAQLQGQTVTVPSPQQVADHQHLSESLSWTASWGYAGRKLSGLGVSSALSSILHSTTTGEVEE